MDMDVFALAGIAAIYTAIVLIPYNVLLYLCDQFRRRPIVMHKSVQPTQSNFALTEGQTLVGVIDTTKVMCFFIDHDTRDAKPYD
jgi:hypothetical protein